MGGWKEKKRKGFSDDGRFLQGPRVMQKPRAVVVCSSELDWDIKYKYNKQKAGIPRIMGSADEAWQ